MLNTQLERHLTVLCHTIGERHLGSVGEEQAVEYLASEFEAIGYKVSRESFDAPGWRYGAFELTADNSTSYPCFPCFYSPGGNVSGPLVLLNLDLHPEASAEELAGKICLAYGDFETVLNTNALAERFDQAGVSALIIASPYQDTFSTKLIRTPNLQHMLVMTVSRNTALDLARAHASGAEFKMSIEAETFQYKAVNVVARLASGSSGPLHGAVAAHFDTAPGIQGAADNATGTAALLELARILKPRLETADAPAIEFVACNGEEVACLGHREYLRRRVAEGATPAWTMDIDAVGTYLGEMVPSVSRSRALFKLVTQSLIPHKIKPRYRAVIAHPFNLPHAPMVHFNEPKNPNGNGHYPLHSPQDDMRLVDIDTLTSHTNSIAAVLEQMFNWHEPPRRTWEVTPFSTEYLPQIETIVRKIWTMGIDKAREDRFGVIGGRTWDDHLWETFKTVLQNPGHFVFVTLAEGRVIGFFTGWTNSETKIGELGANGVDPDWAGQGIGGFQMDTLLTLFRERGMRFAEVGTGLNAGHAPARAMYERLGFEPLSESVRYAMKL